MEWYKCELLVLKTALGAALLLLAVRIMDIKDVGRLRTQLYKPLSLQEVVGISLKGICTAAALRVRPSPGVSEVPNKNVGIPINKRSLY